MHKLPLAAATPMIGLALYLVGVEVLTATLRAHGHLEPGLFVVLRAAGWLGWLGWWYEDDCRSRGKTPMFDMGLFVMLAGPMLLVQRLFLEPRRPALLSLLRMIGIYAAAKDVGMLVYALQVA